MFVASATNTGIIPSNTTFLYVRVVILRTMHNVRFVHTHIHYVVEYLSQKIMECVVCIEQNNDSTHCKLHSRVVIYGTVFCVINAYTLWERFTVIYLHVYVLAENVHLIDVYTQQILPDLFLAGVITLTGYAITLRSRRSLLPFTSGKKLTSNWYLSCTLPGNRHVYDNKHILINTQYVLYKETCPHQGYT